MNTTELPHEGPHHQPELTMSDEGKARGTTANETIPPTASSRVCVNRGSSCANIKPTIGQHSTRGDMRPRGGFVHGASTILVHSVAIRSISQQKPAHIRVAG